MEKVRIYPQEKLDSLFQAAISHMAEEELILGKLVKKQNPIDERLIEKKIRDDEDKLRELTPAEHMLLDAFNYLLMCPEYVMIVIQIWKLLMTLESHVVMEEMESK